MQKEHPILFSTPMVQAILEGRKTMTRRAVKPQPESGLWQDEVRGENIEPIMQDYLIKSRKDLGKTSYSLFDNLHKCPYGKVGDVLWVRETWRKYYRVDEDGYTDFNKDIIEFAADNPEMINERDGDGRLVYNKNGTEKFIVWRPSIFMPRKACRIRLEITDIKVERVQAISEDDAEAEGVEENACNTEVASTCPSSFCKENGCSGKDQWRRYPVDYDIEPCYSAKESFQSLWESINGRESWKLNPWVWAITFKRLP